MANIFGNVPLPNALNNLGPVETGPGKLLQIFVDILLLAGGIYALFNFMLAGYAFFAAGDDPKKIEGAWAKIWQTAIGLLFLAGSFVLAAIFGKLIYGDWGAILDPSLPSIN